MGILAYYCKSWIGVILCNKYRGTVVLSDLKQLVDYGIESLVLTDDWSV